MPLGKRKKTYSTQSNVFKKVIAILQYPFLCSKYVRFWVLQYDIRRMERTMCIRLHVCGNNKS